MRNRATGPLPNESALHKIYAAMGPLTDHVEYAHENVPPPGVAALIVLGGAAFLEAQRRGFGRQAPSIFMPRGGGDAKAEFVIARWYSSDGRTMGGLTITNSRGTYPQIMKEVSLIDTDRLSYKIVDLASPEIFNYPFAYLASGEVVPSDEEIVNLREYVERGGFLMLDDFGGQGQGAWEMQGFLNILRRAFPGREMYPLKDDHELLGISYDIDNLNMEHPMSGAKSTFYGFDDGKGRLAMVIC
jgi:hypothetical protein